MSWSRKGALLGAILGLLVVLVVGFNGGRMGSLTLWNLIMGPVIGALSGWGIGKVMSK